MRKYTYFILILILQFGCNSNNFSEEKKSSPDKIMKSAIKSGVVYHTDIGNHKANLTIKKSLKKSSNEFFIKIGNVPELRFGKYLDKSDLKNALGKKVSNDKLQILLENSRLHSITYNYIHGNTLHLKANLKHPRHKENFVVHFGLFYKGEKKGLIYDVSIDDN